MGLGVFDDQASSGSPGDQISDIFAAGIGASYRMTDDLSLGVDLWYAMKAEDKQDGTDIDDKLGTEIDVSASYRLMEDLSLKVVAAYLWAYNGTNPSAGNESSEDPMEIGAMLSFRF